MEALLFSMLLTCEQGKWLIGGAMNATGLSAEQRVEVAQRIMEQTEEGCDFNYAQPR